MSDHDAWRALLGYRKIVGPDRDHEIAQDISESLAKRYKKPRKRDSSRQMFHAPHQWHAELVIAKDYGIVRVVGEYWVREGEESEQGQHQ